MPIAYSYIRFSSEKQKKGASIQRQEELATKFIKDNPELELDLDTALNMRDLGVSAFKGKNMTDGALGNFTALVYQGKIEQGSFLLLENLDRFSRDEAWIAVNDLTTLIRAGINVVTMSDATPSIYSAETMTGSDGTMKLMQSVLHFTRSHDESAQKSRRIKDAWNRKFNSIEDGKQLTARVPFWIEKTDRTKSIPDKVAVVKQIYKLASSGLGAMRIAQELNAAKVPTPSRQSKQWALSSVKKVLASEAVLGTLVAANGNRYENYYPVIINQKTWTKTRYIGTTSSTARATTEAHPLSGLMFCSCGATAQRSGKTGRKRKDGTKNFWKTLVCAKSMSNPKDENGNPIHRKDCKYQSISYDTILNNVKAALIRMEDFDPSDEVGKNLKIKRREADHIESWIELVTAPLDGKPVKETPSMRANLAKMFDQLDAKKAEIAELELLRRPVSQRLFEGARKAILAGEVTNGLMRQTIKKCVIDFRKRTMNVYGHDGSSVLDLYLDDPKVLASERRVERLEQLKVDRLAAKEIKAKKAKSK